MKLKTMNYLDLSTGHITLEDSQRLAEHALEEVHGGHPPITVAAYEYGWFVVVPGELTEDTGKDADNPYDDKFWDKVGVSDALKALMIRCSKEGIAVVRIDQDGDYHSDLPKFDW